MPEVGDGVALLMLRSWRPRLRAAGSASMSAATHGSCPRVPWCIGRRRTGVGLWWWGWRVVVCVRGKGGTDWAH